MMGMDKAIPGRLFFRAAAFLLLPVLLLSGAACWGLIQRERTVLATEHWHHIRNHLEVLAGQSRIPLLENDVISLITLTRTAKALDGVVAAAISNAEQRVVAHTDPSHIGRKLRDQQRGDVQSAEDLTELLAAGAATAKATLPIRFQERDLGKVHLELGLQGLHERLIQARSEVLQGLLLPVGAATALALLVSLYFSWWAAGSLRRLNRSIGRCISGGAEAEEGDSLPKELLPVYEAVKEMSEKCRFELTRLKALDSAAKPGFSPWLRRSQEDWPMQISRTQVSVLFAGIKGFRAYAQERNPRDLLEDLNEFFELVKRSISFQGGYVDKFIGDAVIAVFTPSPEHGEHTRSAVNSAIDLQHVLAKTSRGGNLLLNRVGIGISSGVVLAGQFGEGEEKMHTFIGESFKAAYSLNVMAGPGEILISKEVYELLENKVSVEPVPPLEVTNTTASWENFRILRSNEGPDAE